MGSVTPNPVKLEKTSLAASKHKLDNLFTDTRIVLHANLYDEFHSESKRPLSLRTAYGPYTLADT